MTQASPLYGGRAVERKVAPEVLDHVAQLDFTDGVSEHPPFGVLCALACSRCSPCSVRGAPARARLAVAARRGSAAGRVTAASRVLDRHALKGGAAGADSGDFRRTFPPVKLSGNECTATVPGVI
jgi:hypothetical protein